MKDTLPKIETPEVAKMEMKEEYFALLDAASKFAALSSYYSQPENSGTPVYSGFSKDYFSTLEKLKAATKDDFFYIMAKSCSLYLGYIGEMWEAIEEYKAILTRDNTGISDYDVAYDYLTVKDTFTDFIHNLNEINQIILSNKSVENHPGNKNYDLDKAQQEKINPEE